MPVKHKPAPITPANKTNFLTLAIETGKLLMSFKYTANTLKKLELLFDEMRYTVRYEKGNFNSGYCLLEDKRVVVINKFLNVEGRINALVEILPSMKINEAELSGDMQKWYKQLQGASIANNDGSVQTQMDI